MTIKEIDLFLQITRKLFSGFEWDITFDEKHNLSKCHGSLDPFHMYVAMQEGKYSAHLNIVTVGSETGDLVPILELRDYDKPDRIIVDMFANVVEIESRIRSMIGI